MDISLEIPVSSEKLDLKDKKILLMLSENARAPMSAIAKVVGLSRDSVKYRIDGYRKGGILKGEVTVVNVSKLGYDAYHIFLRLSNPSKDAEGSIIGDIGRMPHVRAILKFFGSYDLEIVVIAKNLGQFDIVLTEIISISREFIQDYEIMVITKAYAAKAFPDSFFKGIDTGRTNLKLKKSIGIDYMPDKKDLQIMKMLRNDARMPAVEIADKLGLSQDAVSYRLKKLMENIIVDFIPAINYRPLGYTIHAILLNISPLDKETDKKLGNFLSNNENVLWAVKTIGRFNLLAYICTRKESELQDTINQLRSMFPEQIKHYESLLGFDIHKYTYAPDCLFD